MQSLRFEEILQKIIQKDQRYHRDAYMFMREALEFTQRTIGVNKREAIRHVSGEELLDGIRRYSLEQFGPMVTTVFSEWGIRTCEDFGELVFNMVEQNLLAKTESDSRNDFKKGYSFYEAFEKPYLPAGKLKTTEPKSVRV